MRRRVLVNSVRRLLPDDIGLVDVVFMWRRSAFSPLWAAATAVTVYLLASLRDDGSAGFRVGIALAAAVIAVVVTTDNRVLAHTSAGPYLFRASRVRQVAVSSIGPLATDGSIEMVGSNLVLTDWMVDGERYTVPKRSQAAMTALADAF